MFVAAKAQGFGVRGVEDKTPVKTVLAFKDMAAGLRRGDPLYAALLTPPFDPKAKKGLMEYDVFARWKASKIQGASFARAIYIAACFHIVDTYPDFFPPPAADATDMKFGDVTRENVNRAMCPVRYLTDDEVAAISSDVRIAPREATAALKASTAVFLDDRGFDADADLDEEFSRRIEIEKAAGVDGLFNPDGNSAVLSIVSDFTRLKASARSAADESRRPLLTEE
ncbi:hypothetical protein PV10_04776 [Exophiala mesophila]|uniref:Uncharacterized protein n=1 Tax=Exophiala mesophila TaxID=212818 RepID=A0A0D1WW44_EXOME|nr:uncharacterized protein PV10_04776 [Exophiala mesophila]KIV93570.1 hypothetical protein PV10_04776 [Exophiala mesophila]